MLKHIPKSFTPEFLSLLMKMGHGEQLLITDANFPAITAKQSNTEMIYLPILSISQLLEEILYFYPLDETVDEAAIVMESSKETSTYEIYRRIIQDALPKTEVKAVPRFDFYDLAKEAVGIVVTSDTVKGGNILIRKGVVRDE